MKKNILILIIILSTVGLHQTAVGNILFGEKKQVEDKSDGNKVIHTCLQPEISPELSPLLKKQLKRANPWSLPEKALDAEALDTLNILVLRYNFLYETEDDPNTTGRGLINLSNDSAAFYDSAGHYIDPPPHNAAYFGAHLRALKEYLEIISEDRISLSWEIYPKTEDSAYQLPHQMNHYGKCSFDSVVTGLENYFVDCITTADNASPDIVFSDYDGFILFHAGSDQQNNIGFPETCADLFTGFIAFGDSVAVDGDTNFVRSALLMPETGSQDNRATALNAVIAHEFGHQLGLVDLYSTATFMSQLGDFALMDNNGFGTGIDFGFDVGNVFGAIPLFPTAWSRAYLGFVDVVDFRQGSDIRLVAAEIVSDGIKVARVPISENEYYLLENRLVEVDGQNTGAQSDTVTSVILGPAYVDPQTGNIIRSREYDFLMPGSGVLIYHVDEKVAALDYDYDGLNNFQDNDLQWAWDIYGNPVNRFITLVEGDGFVNFGGYYRSGYGSEDDMYREDRNDALTPNTNPPSIDNTGNNTHVYITDISRDEGIVDGFPVIMDTVIRFNVEIDKLVTNFPVRAGNSEFPISPIVDDLDGDGNKEIITVARDKISIFGSEGNSYLIRQTGCTSCPAVFDTAIASVHPGERYIVPIFVKLQSIIFTSPVTGNFADNPHSTKLVAVGGDFGAGRVDLYNSVDSNNDGMADISGPPNQGFFYTFGDPIAMTFGDILYVLTDSGYVYHKDSFLGAPTRLDALYQDEYHGLARHDSSLIVMAGDDQISRLYYLNRSVRDSIDLDGHYTLGPIVVDVDRDGINEVAAGSPDGEIILVSVYPDAVNKFEIKMSYDTDFDFSVNPIASDVDLDGYPELIFSGTNAVYAFDRNLTLKANYPREFSDRFLSDRPAASPIAVDINSDSKPELIIPSLVGNMYALGENQTYGFPMSAGELGVGSPIYYTDTTGGKFGYLGLDGWFYLWEVDTDNQYDFWPMNNSDPSGSNVFNADKLPVIKTHADNFVSESFYNYPNPVVDGNTTVRYFLGEQATSVDITLYDFSGEEIDSFSGPTIGNADNEMILDCSGYTPGVYRCVINIDFNGEVKTAFTDIAVIK